MLQKEKALNYYQHIVDNNKSGNYVQKSLTLRLILDNVLLEMFPNICEQDLYRARIDQIFETKKMRGEYHTSLSKKQWEYHQLRIYLNNVMHSRITADENGYRISAKRLSSLINFCSQIDVPDDVSAIFADIENKSLSTKMVRLKEKSEVNISKVKVESEARSSVPPTLCIIIDRRNDFSIGQLLEIEKGINTIKQDTSNSNFNFIVFTIKPNSSILAFPLSQKINRFSFNSFNDDEQIKPLRDYLVNLNPEIQYHFLLTKATEKNNFRLPVSLNESSLLMRIGIVEKGSNGLVEASNLSNFDKLILDSNLPSFFDWIVKIINNE